MADTGRGLELHAQAVAQGVFTPSEEDRVWFIAAVERARAVDRADPA